ncbi:DNA-directed RNA polymerase [Thermoplasmatales archaeon ex4572_165]|nr:MAG: DNA-directed RNA polymerase [Thermoplasmatales archaeon ex4572_165]RLF59147.1 MAG: DNA-directed RNA polymerase [Thermoplasmata archaeon]
MYYKVKIEDTIRIMPDLFGEDLDEVVRNIVQKTFEGTIRKNHGIIVVAQNITPVGDGIVIHGDGAMYQKISFDALTYKPEIQEVVDALICEIVEFGAFCHIGPIDALIHMSQIMNDYVQVDSESEIITGKEKKQKLQVGDPVRARIVAISLNEISARESKIGLTMRQPALGSHTWIYEKEKEEKSGSKKNKGKKQKKEGKSS